MMTSQRLEFQVPEQHPCYAGHFPGNPVVPGALLLEWLQALVEEQHPGRRLCAVNSLKFLGLVLPGTQLSIEIQSGGGNKVKLRATSGAETLCTGNFTLEDASGLS